MEHISASLKRNRDNDQNEKTSTDAGDLEQRHPHKRSSKTCNRRSPHTLQSTPPTVSSTSTPTSITTTTSTTDSNSTALNYSSDPGGNSIVNTSNSNSEVKLYSPMNQGPFVVFAEPIDPAKVKGHLHPTTTGRLLAASYAGNIISISPSGSLKISITLHNMDAANRLLKDQSFSAHNLRFSIPSHRLNR